MKARIKVRIEILNLIKLSFLLMALFPLIPNKIKGLPIILMLLLSLLIFKNAKQKIFNKKLFFLNSGVYIMYLFSLLYTSNMVYALNKLETGLALILIPLIFVLISSTREIEWARGILLKFIFLFFVSVFLYASIIFLYLINKGWFSYFEDYNFVRHHSEFMPFIGQHSIYSSIFLGLALISSVYLLKVQKKMTIKILVLIANLFISILLISLASKGVLLATFLSLIVYILLLFNSIKMKIITILILIILLILSLIYSPSLSNRVRSLNNGVAFSTFHEKLNSNQTRNAIYLCSIKSMQGNWLFGFGVGDVKDSLRECYMETSESLVIGNYNSHNQYLSIILGTGLIGLFVFLSFLFICYKAAIMHKNYLFIAILIFYSTIMFIENILERQSGVIMFSFLMNFFYFSPYNDNALIEYES